MTARLGTWIVRSGEEIKLQLPPFHAAPVFMNTLQITREGTRLILRGVQNNFVIWEVQIDVGEAGKTGRMPAGRLLTEDGS